MPIIETDLNKFYLTGGVANADISASLGGAISSVELTNNSLHNLFDLVSSDEATAGDLEYRCFALKNTHATITLLDAKVWIVSDSTSADTSVSIGISPAGLDGTEELVGNESTAPANVTFTAPASKATGIALGDIPAGSTFCVWVRRTVNALTSAVNSDSVTIGFGGDTTA